VGSERQPSSRRQDEGENVIIVMIHIFMTIFWLFLAAMNLPGIAKKSLVSIAAAILIVGMAIYSWVYTGGQP
jgi:hypothetical protein